jgi:hypothetical protein
MVSSFSPHRRDPYINVDAGTMNPTEHGEVFVLADGYETDQDMGNYERFMGLKLSRENYMTTGSVYKRVIERERNLEYHGKCVEVVPHIPLEVIGTINRAAEKADALKKENEDLKALMGRKEDKNMILSQVIKKPPYSPYDSFILDVGEGHGIKKYRNRSSI